MEEVKNKRRLNRRMFVKKGKLKGCLEVEEFWGSGRVVKVKGCDVY